MTTHYSDLYWNRIPCLLKKNGNVWGRSLFPDFVDFLNIRTIGYHRKLLIPNQQPWKTVYQQSDIKSEILLNPFHEMGLMVTNTHPKSLGCSQKYPPWLFLFSFSAHFCISNRLHDTVEAKKRRPRHYRSRPDRCRFATSVSLKLNSFIYLRL